MTLIDFTTKSGQIAASADIADIINHLQGASGKTDAWHFRVSSGNNYLITLADAAGAQKFSVRDSAGTELFQINSDGLVTFAAQAAPTTPSTGYAAVYVDSTTKLLSVKNDAAVVQTVPLFKTNQSVTTPGAGFSSDTYLVGSSIAIPSGYPHVGAMYRLTFDVSKTAAGTAAPVVTIRYGTAGTTADTARLTFTFTAGTAAADTGKFEIDALFRTVGSGTSAVLQGAGRLTHGADITGLSTLVAEQLQVTSGGFDSTVASSIIGASVNGGASAAWTIALVRAEFVSQ